MLNLVRRVKTDPATYLTQYGKGSVRRQGSGLSFVCFAPSATLASVPWVRRASMWSALGATSTTMSARAPATGPC